MTDKLLDEYKAYYAVRAEKYAGNPNYPNYYVAEKRLSEAFQNCSDIDEIKDKVPSLSEQCAIALVKDGTIMDQKHYEKHQETVRILSPNRILEKLGSCKSTADIITITTEEGSKSGIEISMDEANHFFVDNWENVDLIEIYSNAEVPEKYKADLNRWANDLRESILDGARTLEENNDDWQNGWKLNPEVISEYRHRRLLPYSDEQIQTQIARFKKIIHS